MSVSNKRSVAGARASARSLKTDVGTGRVRSGLMGSSALVGVAVAISLAGLATSAQATTYSATTYAELVAAINAANANPGADTITIGGDITLAGLLPAITGATTVDGGNFTISGGDQSRLFFVDALGQSVVFNNMVMADGRAVGGAGGTGGGGGGMGAGGAIFVNAGAVTASNVSFAGNDVVGGAGAVMNANGSGGGGGGGLGGSGGGAGNTGGGGGGYSGGGGGGGSQLYNGAPNGGPAGAGGNGPGGAGGAGSANSNGEAGVNGGAGGTLVTQTAGATINKGGGGGGGGTNGGAGGNSQGGGGGGAGYTGAGGTGGSNNAGGTSGGIGGGGGGSAGAGVGGNGGDFGGGGGGYYAYNAGSGGFGGGGAGGYGYSTNGVGGAGGFGGGGGAAYSTVAPGAGGVGAGTGTSGRGGGGAGLGGAVFVRPGGDATFAMVMGATGGITGGSATGGAITGGKAGAGAGAGLFLGSGTTTTLTTTNGVTSTIQGIADDSATGLVGGTYTAGSGAGANITVDGTGTLALSGTNAWGGVTTIASGATLQGAASAMSGSNIVNNGNLIFNTAGTSAEDISGSGSVQVTGTGVVLNGDITSTGQVSVSGAGAGLTLGGARSGGSTTGVLVNGAGAGLTVSDGGSIQSGQYNGVRMTGVGSQLTNLGTIQNSGTGGDGAVGAGVYVQNAGAGGTTTITNGSLTDTGAGSVIRGQNAGVRHESGSTDTLVVNNYGNIIGNLYNGIENTAGGLTVSNFSGGYIYGSVANGISSASGSTVSVTNAGVIGQNAAATQTVAGSGVATGSALALTNQTGGLLIGQTTGVSANGAVSGSNAGTIRGTVASGGTAGSGMITGNGGSFTNTATGQILGASFGIRNTAGALTLANAGTITGASEAVSSVGALTLTNTGTITGGVYSGVTFRGTGSVTNSGTITGGSSYYAVQNASANGLTTITNQSGGILTGGTSGSILIDGNGATTIDLQAGSTTNGAIAAFGSGARGVTIAGALSGTYNGSTGSGIDTLILAATGTMTSASLGDGNDSFTTRGGTFSGTLNGGAGTDGFVTDMGTGSGSVTLANVTNFETLSHLSGTVTLSGTSGSAFTAITAGNGTPSGTLIFDGTSNLTSTIAVDGAVIRAETAGAFGTGTITMIDPTVEYGATGTYANNIVLSVVAPASADPSTFSADAGVTATLSGSITQGGGDAFQPVVIGGLGTIVLTNAGNSWAGSTTIDAGATLQGTAGTISGSEIVSNGTLTLNQGVSGDLGLDISGTGDVTSIGTASLTLSGTNTYSGATTVSAGTLIASGGSAIGDTSAVSVAGGATLSLTASEAVGSLSGTGTVDIGLNTLTVGGDNTSTEFSGAIIDPEAIAYIGSWNVADGPNWSVNPPTYTGQDAAALLFGGSAGDYRISTAGTDIATITDTAWYNRYGGNPANFTENASDFSVDTLGAGYNTQSDSSAYVGDHTGTPTYNYAFTGGQSLGGSLTHVGTGTLILSGTNTYTGNTVIQAGTLELRNGAAIANTGLISIDSGGTLAVTDAETIGNLTGTGATTLAANLTLTAASGTYGGNMSGVGGLALGGGSLTLSGTNTYSGATTVSAGTLIASGGGAIGDTSAVSVAGGATLNLAAAETIGSLAGSGTVQVGANTLTVGGDNTSTEFSGSITDGGAFSFLGSWLVSDGAQYGTAPPIYSGQEAAALLFGGNAADYRISTAGNDVATITDTAWYSGYGFGWAEFVDDLHTDLGVAGYSQVGDYSAYVRDFTDLNKINYVFGVDANGHAGGGLTHVGTGTLTLSGTNTYTGDTVIQAGTLELRNGAAIADTGLVSIAAGGTLAVNTSETIGNLTGDGATTLGGILTLSAGSGTYDGNVSGAGTLTLGGGTLTLGGTLTNAGGLTLGSGTTATISATGAVTPAGTVAVIMSDGSSLTNRGSVSGSSLGVLGLSGTFNVVNSGTIAGANAAGVQAQGNLTLTNQTGGSISGRTGVYASGVATVTNAAGATISAGSLSNTVRLAGTGSSLTNAGDITGTTTYAGVFFDRTGTVTNQAGGLISNTGTAVQFTGAGSVLDNAGTISNTNTTSAVYFGSSGSVTNRAAGVITSNNWAVELVGDTASVTNAGSITGQRGVHLWGADSVLDNSGTITGSRTAVGTTGTSTITNALGGTLAGTTYNGVFGSGAGTSVDNAGLITGGNAAIYLEGADNTVTNTGTIQVTGTTAPTVISGVYMSGAGASLTNSGTIESTLTDGRGVYLAGSTGAITNQSGGVISGNGTGAAIILTGVDYTVDLQSGSTVNGLIDASVSTGHNALTVAGTLNGGYAGGTGADDITLIAGMTVTGLMDGGAGTDSLVLDGAADSALNMGLTTGFESRTLDGTGVWTLSGIDGDAAGWTLNAGTLRVTGSQSVNNGAGVRVNSGATLSIVDSEAIGGLNGSGAVTLDAGQMLFVGVDGSSGTFDGVIAGAGGLSQYGAGILTLSGANTYTGDTRVDFGTLRLGASGVIADASILFVASGATLDLRGHDETVAIAVLNGTVNGTGVPAAPLFTAGKGGDGRSTLPAEAVALAAVGTGTLTAAEYQLNGATINANLGTGNLFNTGGVSTLNGTASAGLVSLQAGTLWLGADERLADTATVSVSSGATLDLNDQTETIGSLYGMGDVAIGAGQLTFGGTESAFGGILTGSGSLVHTGGLFTLAGNHTLASLNSTGGELRFLGTTTGGVSVTGGSLTGAGTIGGALTMAAGAILSPGLAGQVGSIGTFTAGSLDLNGATLALGVLGTVGGNLSDRLVITGTADLTGGVIAPTFMAQPGGYDFVTRYQFLTAGNLVGTFSNGSEFAAASGQTGMYWRVVYDLTPNAAVLELRKLTDFTLGAGGSANQNAVGQALSGGQLDAGADWSAVLELLSGLNGTQQQAAFDSMGGEALADMSSSLLVANDAFAGAVRQAGASRTPGATPLNFASAFSFVGGRDGAAAMITGVLDAFDPSAGTGSADGGWISVHASDVDLDGKAGQADLQTRLNAFVGGYAVGAGDYVLGAAAGATRVESKVEARQSSFESDLLHAAVYARFDDGRWAADLTASAYGGELDSRRTITVGAFTGQARGQTHGEGQSLSASVARRFVHEDGSAISVGLMQTLSRSTVDAFTETGAGGLSLESADKTRNWQTTQVNLRGTQDYQLSGQPLRLYGGLGLLVTTGDREAGADLRFSGAATGFGGYTIEGAQAAPLAATTEFGFEYQPREGLTLSTGYRGVFSERLRDDQIGARMSIAW